MSGKVYIVDSEIEIIKEALNASENYQDNENQIKNIIRKLDRQLSTAPIE